MRFALCFFKRMRNFMKASVIPYSSYFGRVIFRTVTYIKRAPLTQAAFTQIANLVNRL